MGVNGYHTLGRKVKSTNGYFAHILVQYGELLYHKLIQNPLIRVNTGHNFGVIIWHCFFTIQENIQESVSSSKY